MMGGIHKLVFLCTIKKHLKMEKYSDNRNKCKGTVFLENNLNEGQHKTTEREGILYSCVRSPPVNT